MLQRVLEQRAEQRVVAHHQRALALRRRDGVGRARRPARSRPGVFIGLDGVSTRITDTRPLAIAPRRGAEHLGVGSAVGEPLGSMPKGARVWLSSVSVPP